MLLAKWLRTKEGQYCFVSAHDALPQTKCLSKVLESMVGDSNKIGIACAEYGVSQMAKYSPILGPRLRGGGRVSGTLFREEAFVYYSFMGRVRRVDVGGMVYHALNRANFRSRLFKKEEHYRDFLILVEESLEFVPMRILAYCLMPNHWHMVLYPRADGDLSRFLQRITLTHTQRYHAKTRTVGYGHIYQGRYKSLPVEEDGHFLTLVRYVERNAQRAGLVKRAEEWRWSSVDARLHGNDGKRGCSVRGPSQSRRNIWSGLTARSPRKRLKRSDMR